METVGANRLEQNQEVQAGLFIGATEFIKGFADGCHHKK
jgi:hemerythrin-like domain-containing protein